MLAQAPSSMPSTSFEIRIGHAGPLSGNLSRLGRDIENGVRLALEQANAAGYTIGGKTATFVLLSEDDRANPKDGVAAAQKLVAARVAGVVGHLNSSTSVAASSVYSQAGIPVISPSATNPRLTGLGSRVQFRVIGRDDDQGPALANYLAAHANPQRVAVVDDSTAYGESIADGVAASLRSKNIAVVAREKGKSNTSDWRAVLSTLQAGRPDVVIYGGMDDTAGPLLKQARDLGIDAQFLFGDGACSGSMARLAGAAAEGLLCVQAGREADAATTRFVDAYKARFNVAPVQYAPGAYDAANVLIEAMKKADSAEPSKFLPALARISLAGATGTIAFDSNGDLSHAPFTVFTMKGGRLEQVAEVEVRGAEARGREAGTGERMPAAGSAVPVAGAADTMAAVCDSGSASSSKRFTAKDGVVIDRKTGLTWQRCSVGQKWAGARSCEGMPKQFRWNEIVWEVRDGWRLPTQQELVGIQAKGCPGAAIDSAVFPNTPRSMFWSSTVYDDGNPGFAFFGGIGGGGSGPASEPMYLRLVRDR